MENKKDIPQLSKGILEMKFMKKTKEHIEKVTDDAQTQEMYSNQITDEMRRAADGRISFGGMNPEIEKLMNKDFNKRIEENDKRKEKDVNDVEMAEGYSSLNKTIEKKFKGKNKGKERNNKNFIKPPEDF